MQSTADPSQAQGAQIPLTSFNVPDFPPAARGLKALTLTSEIPVTQYTELLSQPFSIPSSIPYGIESLTLELFSLGYPSGFLKRLAERLPNLKSVVIYSQLFSGLTQQSQDDAIEFFKRSQNLRALHLLDVFAKPGFFTSAAKWLKYNDSDTIGEARRGLMFLEVNYTYDHNDGDLMSKIAADELQSLVGPGLISCSFNISPAEGEDQANSNGIMAFSDSLSSGLVSALTREDSYPRALKALNTTLFTMSLKDVRLLAEKHKNLSILNVTIQLRPEDNVKQEILDIVKTSTKLEQLEVVGHPSLQYFMAMSAPGATLFQQACPSIQDLESLTGNLQSLKLNILRASTFGSIAFTKKDGKWSRQ